MFSIFGWYHVAMFPGWESLVEDQVQRLKRSGLFGKTERIFVGVVGPENVLPDTLFQLFEGKADIRYFGNVSRYEFPTLSWLHDTAQQTTVFGLKSQIPPFYAWYIHTKGVSCRTPLSVMWRNQMESVVLDQHEKCCEALQIYDACGTYWRTDACEQNKLAPHFSGNFWWATSRYLGTLISPDLLDQSNRYEAEFWIGSNPRVRILSF